MIQLSGLLSISAGVEGISPLGIAATAGIVGMFSKEAVESFMRYLSRYSAILMNEKIN